MRMKMFAADSLDAARALVFAEMGDGAVILSEREVEGGVEVRAATEGKGRGSNKPLYLRGGDGADEVRSSVLSYRVRDALAWHGAPKRFADRVLHAADHELSDPVEALASGLSSLVACDPLPARPERDVLLVGAPGHGRTSTAAKLTRRAAVAKTLILPVAADFDGTAGGEQLSAYLERERAQVRIATDPDALFTLLEDARRQDERCIIDLPAIIPFDREDLARLRDLVAAIDAEPVLVLSAEGHPDDQADAAKAFASAGIRRAILTKLDVARRRGGAVAALAGAKIALSHLAVTPFIGGGLVPATQSRLAALLMEEAAGEDALRGAA